jgi:hypothetical protein
MSLMPNLKPKRTPHILRDATKLLMVADNSARSTGFDNMAVKPTSEDLYLVLEPAVSSKSNQRYASVRASICFPFADFPCQEGAIFDGHSDVCDYRVEMSAGEFAKCILR